MENTCQGQWCNSISASVDNTLEITILSESVYDIMSPCPNVLSNVDVNLAGGGSTMSVGSLGPVQLEIDGDKVEHCVHVAPLHNYMLLGIDFLQKCGVELECGTGELQLGDSVPLQLMHKDKTGSVKAVSVRWVRLPPLSVGVVECAVSKELPDVILEQFNKSPLGVLQARSLNISWKSGKICIINMTQWSYGFKVDRS